MRHFTLLRPGDARETLARYTCLSNRGLRNEHRFRDYWFVISLGDISHYDCMREAAKGCDRLLSLQIVPTSESPTMDSRRWTTHLGTARPSRSTDLGYPTDRSIVQPGPGWANASPATAVNPPLILLGYLRPDQRVTSIYRGALSADERSGNIDGSVTHPTRRILNP